MSKIGLGIDHLMDSSDDIYARVEIQIVEYGSRLQGKKKINYAENGSERRESLQDPESSEEKETEDAITFKPSKALVEDVGVSGSEVFGFKTPKKTNQMVQKASASAKASTPKTPRSSSSSQTPKSILKTPRSSSSSETPKSILKKTPRSSQVASNQGTPRRSTRRTSRRLAHTTPHRLRARNREGDRSSSEDSVSSSDSGEDCESDVEKQPEPEVPKPSTPASKTPVSKKKRKTKDEDNAVEVGSVDAYFDATHGPTLTSDRTLARLETPRMDHAALSEALSGLETAYLEEREALSEEYQSHFNKWMFQLCNGYNLMFHGLGSKRKLIEKFRTTMLKLFPHIVVNGYFPSLTIKNILNAITEDVLDHSGSFRTPIDQCDFIRKHYECGDYEDFYIVIHNIDGTMLRSEKVQLVLSLLAQIRGFHIVASIDHINAPLIWDQNKSSRFNWLWYDVTTYEAYTEETSYENSLLVQQSGVLALSSLTHVMHSLTPNAKGIFLLLVRHQLENKDNSTYQGLAFPDLYQKCREAFLVNSDLTLRTQLTEFRDHKLIRTKKGYDGVEYLVIPLDPATLEEFLEQQEDAA